MVMIYGLNGPGFLVGVGDRVSLLHPRPVLSWQPAQPPSQWLQSLFRVETAAGPKVDHPHLWNAAVKNKWSYTSIPPVRLHGILRGDIYWSLNLMFLLNHSNLYRVDPCGRAVWGAGLRPLACWDCGCESHQSHRCLSVVSVVCCQV